MTNSDSENESRYDANIGNDSSFAGLLKCGYELALFLFYFYIYILLTSPHPTESSHYCEQNEHFN